MSQFVIQKASRLKKYLKINISGVSGAGKTMGALLVAKGLVGSLDKVCVLDTENGSASLYASMGCFDTVKLEPPFTPQLFVNAINFVMSQKQYSCIVIDSISHEYEGQGGLLEIVEGFGGQFSSWGKASPIHKAFLDSLLRSDIHIITTTRKKTDYSMETNDKGKLSPKKVGLKDVQKEGYEYELDLALDVDINHNASVSKTRLMDNDGNSIFDSNIPFKLTDKIGEKIKSWNESGKHPPTISEQAYAYIIPNGEFKGKKLSDMTDQYLDSLLDKPTLEKIHPLVEQVLKDRTKESIEIIKGEQS